MKILLALGAALALCACGSGDGDSSTSVSPITLLEQQGKLPALDRTADLKGPDTNSNGVRDDIDKWIDAQPYSTIQKKAALQSAKALQDSLAVNLTDTAQLRTAFDKITRAVGCIHRQFPPSQSIRADDVLRTLQKYTMNTKDRAMAYIKFNAALNGSQSELTLEDTCV